MKRYTIELRGTELQELFFALAIARGAALESTDRTSTLARVERTTDLLRSVTERREG